MLTASATAAAIVSFVPLPADATTATLPGGTPISNTITSPAATSTVANGSTVTVAGHGEVGATPTSTPTAQLIYVIDRSGSTADVAPGCPGSTASPQDLNGDGSKNTVLDCEIGAGLALNQQAVSAGTIAKVGVVSFDTNATVVQPLVDPSSPLVASGLKSIKVGENTNFQAAVKTACTLAGTSAPTTVVLLSDGVATTGGNAVTAANACGSNVTIQTFAVGSGSSCTNTGNGSGSLAQIAAAKGGTCVAVTDLSKLPTVVRGIADPKVTGVTATVDGNPAPASSIHVTPAPPTSSVSYTWDVAGLAPGNHTLCTTVDGVDVGGAGTVTDCVHVTLADPVRTVSVDDATVSEDGGNATFHVTLDSPAVASGTLHYATSDGSATAGSDYTAVSGTLTFAAGDTSKTIIVPITDDTVYEGSETFDVTLSAPSSSLVLGDASGLGTITDDEGPPTITVSGDPNGAGGSGASVAEGNSGCTPVSVTVKLSNASTTPVTVHYATGGGTATAADYTAVPDTLVTFAPGETSKTISLCVLGDLLDEPDETFNVSLSDPSGGTVPASGASSTVTIIDDDDAPTITVTGNPGGTGGNGASVTEGNAGCTSVTLTVKLSAPSANTVTVHYGTGGGTATAGDDYTSVNDTVVTFAPGETSKQITVCVLGDVNDEPDETFKVTLSNPTAGTIPASGGTSTVTILDDDLPVRMSINDVGVQEGNSGTTPATFTVSLDRAETHPVTVSWATIAGSATAGTDYVANGGTLVFAPGETSKQVTVLVKGDTVDEPDETFTVRLSGISGGTAAIFDPDGTGTIRDDDRNGTFSCSATALQVLALNAFVANGGYSPCADAGASLLSIPLNSLVTLSAKVVNASTDQTPNSTLGTAPALNDRGVGDSSVAALVLVVGGHTITADAVTSHAEARCGAPLGALPTLSGSTVLVNLRIDGKPVVLVNGRATVALAAGALAGLTVWVNKTTTTTNGVTQQAIAVQGSGLLAAVRVVVAEARAGYTGNPCTS